MIEDIYNKQYSLPESVLVGDAEKKIDSFLKGKIKKIHRAGQDLLIEISKEDLHQVIKELKDNPELQVKRFQGTSFYKSKDKNFLLISLTSFVYNFSFLIKLQISQKESREGCPQLIDELAGFYKALDFYRDRSELISNRSDTVIHCRDNDGLDCFDLNISTDGDTVNEAFIDLDISRVLDRDYYRGLGIYDLIAYISRFDWKAGIFPEICLCSAFEELLQLKVPERAIYIRMLLCELYRVSNHLYFISNISVSLGCDMAYNLSLMERERVLRFIEFITGARIIPNFIRIGGVKKDLGSEVLLEIKRSLPLLYRNIKKIEGMMINDFLVKERLKGVGIISKDGALEYGITGPNLRASGIRYDLRKERDFASYKDFLFTSPTGRKGDCLDRVMIRFNEIYQSLRIINQAIRRFPGGQYIKKINLSHIEFQFESVSYNIECPHGLFKVYMELEKSNINSIVVKGPSINSLILGEKILKGNKIEDVNIILSSLDISPGEIMAD
jgi:NADH-quinone oxidoreductase subunit D